MLPVEEFSEGRGVQRPMAWAAALVEEATPRPSVVLIGSRSTSQNDREELLKTASERPQTRRLSSRAAEAACVRSFPALQPGCSIASARRFALQTASSEYEMERTLLQECQMRFDVRGAATRISIHRSGEKIAQQIHGFGTQLLEAHGEAGVCCSNYLRE